MSDPQDAVIKILDIAINSMATMTRLRTLLETARAEGRTITMDEVDALIAESDKLEEAWHRAGNP